MSPAHPFSDLSVPDPDLFEEADHFSLEDCQAELGVSADHDDAGEDA